MDNTDLSDLLKKIDQRLDRIEKQLEPKKSLEAMPLPNEVNILVDTIDESFNPHSENGLKNLDKIESVKNLLNTLSQRETIESIDSLTKSMHKLAPLIEKLKDIEDVICILADSTDEIMLKATQSGVNFEDFSENLKRFSLELSGDSNKVNFGQKTLVFENNIEFIHIHNNICTFNFPLAIDLSKCGYLIKVYVRNIHYNDLRFSINQTLIPLFTFFYDKRDIELDFRNFRINIPYVFLHYVSLNKGWIVESKLDNNFRFYYERRQNIQASFNQPYVIT